jgi:hypothetical protein
VAILQGKKTHSKTHNKKGVSMFNILLTVVKGGKTNTAMIALVLVFALKKFFGVETTETEIMGQIAIILGVVGQLHKVYKSATVQAVLEELKKEEK